MEAYKNEVHSFEERAADLVSRMTLEEKICELGNHGAAIPRLGIPYYNYWSEASHGGIGPSKFREMNFTSFPVCLALSQTWDPDLVEKVAETISDELRAYANTDGDELHMWCPTINLARDPRNGRSDENFGEDAYLTGKMAVSYVKGMQGNDRKYLKTIATPKHFALNSSENNRHTGSAWADEATIRNYYIKPFEECIINGHAASIMTSYNRINGVPASANTFLLNTLLRQEWGFDGFVVSDCGAVADVYVNPSFFKATGLGHFYAESNEEASAITLEAGTDMSCGAEHRKHLLNAIQDGLIQESVLDKALIRIFTSRFRLGLFDPTEKNPFTRIDKNKICSDENTALAVRTAEESIVLLKNENNLLPLNKHGLKKVLVIGPNAIYRQLGGYSPGIWCRLVDTPVNIMPLEGIQNVFADSDVEVLYEKGWCTDLEFRDGGSLETQPGADENTGLEDVASDYLPENISMEDVMKTLTAQPRYPVTDPDKQIDNDLLIQRAVKAAKEADLVIIIAGTDAVTASEEHDRETLELPYGQDEKIVKILDVNPNTVVVLTTLGCVTGKFIDCAHTLVNAHFAGQEQGTALANVLFGKINPSAKLTATWYRNEKDLPSVNDYGLKKQDTLDGKARTYMYFDGEVNFPFGYGKSYTTYSYSNLRLSSKQLDANDILTICADITNTGHIAGTEIAQMYVAKMPAEDHYGTYPLSQLKGFAKVSLEPGECKTVTITLPIKDLETWSNFRKQMSIENGAYRISVGPNSKDTPLSETVFITGSLEEHLETATLSIPAQILNSGEEKTVVINAVTNIRRHLVKDECSIHFISSDPSVALVNDDGKLTAGNPGVCTVTVVVSWHSDEKTASLPICVIKK